MQVCTQAISSGSSARYGHPVGARTVDERMHVPDALDDSGGGLGVAERRRQHIAERGAGPLERVLTVVRQVLNARDHRRVQDLEHDRGQPGLGHRRQVGVDLPRDAVRPEQPRITGWSAVDGRIVVATRGLLEIGDDAPPQTTRWY